VTEHQGGAPEEVLRLDVLRLDEEELPTEEEVPADEDELVSPPGDMLDWLVDWEDVSKELADDVSDDEEYSSQSHTSMQSSPIRRQVKTPLTTDTRYLGMHR